MCDIKSCKTSEGSKIVCTLSGHGLKAPDTAIKQCSGSMITVEAGHEAVKNAILSNLSK
jgi:threonine synthase